MWFAYNAFVRLLFFLFRLASLWRSDAKKWTDARKNWLPNLQDEVAQKGISRQSCIWFHVASLGEFEQGRNLLEMIKKNHPEKKIVLSFFSPSGYENLNNYSYADIITYFPSDLKEEIHMFINTINPQIAIFVKYDFWWNCLRYLYQKNIPYYFISIHLGENNYLRKPIFSTLRNELKNSAGLFFQNEENYKFFESHKFHNIHRSGDTRLDRVLDIANSDYSLPEIIEFKGTQKLLILGSAWSEEINILKQSLHHKELSDWKIIIAPHKTDPNTLSQIENVFPTTSSLYSNFQRDKQILIIDRIGLLSKLYRYADLAFIGGGFGKGIHNTLEPIAHKIPVCFGPHHKRFIEAIEFVSLGLAFEIKDYNSLLSLIANFHNVEFRNNIKNKVIDWINKSEGSTEKIYDQIWVK
ncbi:MAG: 3-deoxy-D-manno-octulosonic acid transferase [Saprospiraceae bacterium]|nr:3-deoxy-D-manno-octulosonic acid transferase [Saprospiraceae bacterium]